MWNDIWYSLGAATGSVATTITGTPVRALRVCSGVRASLGGLAHWLFDREPSPPNEAVEEQPERIAWILREHGVAPNRLGIDGLPGSGKSTLACALGAKLNLQWRSLDYKDLSLPRHLKRERTIFEHHRLFRTQDVDAFDAIIYINESPERSCTRTVRRGRGVILAVLWDYHKLKRVGDIAFEVCEGTPIPVPDSHLIIKIRPPGGFRATENITRRLHDAGLCAAGMSKEEMLFVLAYGDSEYGLMAYFQPFAWFAGLGGLAGWLIGPDRRSTPNPPLNAPSSPNGGAGHAARG